MFGNTNAAIFEPHLYAYPEHSTVTSPMKTFYFSLIGWVEENQSTARIESTQVFSLAPWIILCIENTGKKLLNV